LLATLSHELRTPLTAILAWAQMIRMGIVDYAKAKEGAAAIEQSAKIQSQLIDDLLDVSSITTGKLALEVSEVDPALIIRTACESVRSLMEKKSIQLKVVLSTKVATIKVDPLRLQQILWNLLVNAVKFSEVHGRVEVHQDFFETQGRSGVQIKIIDFGRGITKDFLPHLFRRFSQADSTPTRTHGGLGLGLSIVHNLVQMQGGTVSAASLGVGQGATFTVRFPIIAGKKVPTFKAEPKSEMPLHLDGVRILFVDDDIGSRDSIGLFLRSFGGEVLAVDSARAALRLLRSFKPDILISDISMPDEDGNFLIRKIRLLSHSQGGQVPAIALTAYATKEDVQRSLTAGFQAHMAKPVDATKLVQTILTRLIPRTKKT
jgi:CheY-like chemotaxis protein